MPSEGIEGDEWEAYVTLLRIAETNAGSPNADFHAANSPLAAAWRAVVFGESAQVSRLGPAGARRSRCRDLPASASLTVRWHSRPRGEEVPGISRDHDVHDCLSSLSVTADQLGVPVTAR